MKHAAVKGKIKTMTPALRAEFERRLVEGSFSDYRGLARWLGEHGYVSRSRLRPLQRYGYGLERKLNALRLATEQGRAPWSTPRAGPTTRSTRA